MSKPYPEPHLNYPKRASNLPLWSKGNPPLPPTSAYHETNGVHPRPARPRLFSPLRPHRQRGSFCRGYQHAPHKHHPERQTRQRGIYHSWGNGFFAKGKHFLRGKKHGGLRALWVVGSTFNRAASCSFRLRKATATERCAQGDCGNCAGFDVVVMVGGWAPRGTS